jgi:hypothetical protein
MLMMSLHPLPSYVSLCLFSIYLFVSLHFVQRAIYELIEKTPKMSAVKTAKSPAPVVDENSAGSEIDATAGEEAVKEVEKVDTHDSDDKVEKNSKVEKAEVAVTAPVSVKEETVDCNSLSLLLPVEGIPTSLEFPPKVHDTEGDKAVEVSVLFITIGLFLPLFYFCSLSLLHFPFRIFDLHHFSPLLLVSFPFPLFPPLLFPLSPPLYPTHYTG